MSEILETNPVYFHNCKVLGPETRLPRALMSDSSNTYILYYQHKCPFCNQTGGEKVLADGVTETATGYSIDTTKAEKLHNTND